MPTGAESRSVFSTAYSPRRRLPGDHTAYRVLEDQVPAAEKKRKFRATAINMALKRREIEHCAGNCWMEKVEAPERRGPIF